MTSHFKLEEEIAKAVSSKANQISPSPDLFEKITQHIQIEKQGGTLMTLKPARKFKTALIACLVLMITSAACFAAVSFIHYEKMPLETAVFQELGFRPNYVKTFSTGYAFLEGGVDREFSLSDGSHPLEMRYEKEDLLVHYHAFKTLEGETTLADYKASVSTNATPFEVPLANDLMGLMIQSPDALQLIWAQEGVTYSLSTYDKVLSQDQLIQMAVEIIQQ